ncbi:MAG: UDP-3-O-[3-hydroxymyristoyl] N-acetylglucosamine deacetylase [Candidatus Omnitrophica bacterium]|nr:UDP-3-O-[3-hydroxymyristoyl] N-acetylglucosamine deacetylase [Candidatus Omnitrophota bacterium]
MKKKTIEKEISFEGKALQTGRETRVVCKPNDAGSGIIFKRTDLETRPVFPLSEAMFSSGQRRTVLSSSAGEVQTVEHFLAALWALEIDSLIVELDGAELPAAGGSSIEFLEGLTNAGIKEQPEEREFIKISEKEEVSVGENSLSIFPDAEFSVSYQMEYASGAIKDETLKMCRVRETFKKEIAPARTFCLKAEAEALLKAGLGRGATYENTLVLDETGPVETSFRFENEPVRHKILDLVGDLYLLGLPIIGRVEAKRSGHDLNVKMMRRIYEKYVCKK